MIQEVFKCIFSIYISAYLFLIYRGHITYKNEREIKRKKIVQKYRMIFIVLITLSALSGMLSFKRLLSIILN